MNGTTIRRGARIRAAATAIGLDPVTDLAAARAAGLAMVVVLVLRVARAIRMAMLRRRRLATTVRTVRWLHKILGRFNRSLYGPLRGR